MLDVFEFISHAVSHSGSPFEIRGKRTANASGQLETITAMVLILQNRYAQPRDVYGMSVAYQCAKNQTQQWQITSFMLSRVRQLKRIRRLREKPFFGRQMHTTHAIVAAKMDRFLVH